jgi:hypothetical protein
MMASSKQIVALQFDTLNSEGAQFKPMNTTLKSPEGRPVFVEFEVPSALVTVDVKGEIHLTPEGMATISKEWYKTLYYAKLAADAELVKEAKKNAQ